MTLTVRQPPQRRRPGRPRAAPRCRPPRRAPAPRPAAGRSRGRAAPGGVLPPDQGLVAQHVLRTQVDQRLEPAGTAHRRRRRRRRVGAGPRRGRAGSTSSRWAGANSVAVPRWAACWCRGRCRRRPGRGRAGCRASRSTQPALVRTSKRVPTASSRTTGSAKGGPQQVRHRCGVGAQHEDELVAAGAGDGAGGPDGPRSRSATAHSSWSPASWPCPSLTFLKSSRSSRASRRPVRRARGRRSAAGRRRRSAGRGGWPGRSAGPAGVGLAVATSACAPRAMVSAATTVPAPGRPARPQPAGRVQQRQHQRDGGEGDQAEHPAGLRRRWRSATGRTRWPCWGAARRRRTAPSTASRAAAPAGPAAAGASPTPSRRRRRGR